MHARLVTVQVEPARVGEVLYAVECTEFPATRRQMMLLTLWERKGALRDGELRGALLEELGILALTAWGASSEERPGAPHPASVAGLSDWMGGRSTGSPRATDRSRDVLVCIVR